MFESLQQPIVIKTLWMVGAIFASFVACALLMAILGRKRREELQGMAKNYIAWLFILPSVFVPLLAGWPFWVAFVLVISLLAFREFAWATGLWRDHTFLWVATTCIMGMFYAVFVRWYGLFLVMPIYATLILLSVPLARDIFEGMIQRTCLSVLGVLYFGWCFAHLGYLVHLENGVGHVLFVFLMTELNDVCAYHIGKLLGRHPLSPRISPNKTIEGSLGALAAVTGFAFLLRYLVPEFSTLHLMMIAGLISFTGTFGDLTISFIKRDLGIKDMGKLIPGQGGILDRFDSLIFVSPVFFHFTVYFYGSLLPATRLIP